MIQLPEEVLKEADSIEAEILMEFKLLRELDHPNILRLIEIFRDEQSLCLVTELCKGSNLIEAIKKRDNFSEQEVAFIIWQLLLAVNYCHKKDICHRDIKMDNILLEEESLNVKLLDFGYACLIDP